MHRLMNYIRLDLVHGVTFGNMSLVSLYTSSIFVYAKVLAHNLNVNKNENLPLDANDYRGRSHRDCIMLKPTQNIRIQSYLT